jgi:hypothetical protein
VLRDYAGAFFVGDNDRLARAPPAMLDLALPDTEKCMRLLVALITLPLAACGSAPESRGGGQNLTLGTEQCSKHKWGTPEMAQCLDTASAARTAQRQAAIPETAAAGSQPEQAPAAAPARTWPWNWFTSGAAQ